MQFHPIDLAAWERREYYEHYTQRVVCSYSTTVRLDVTPLRGQRLYPAMLWLLTGVVNEMPEFRTACTAAGVGYYESMHPSYTIFSRENHRFSVIWTEYHPDFAVFREAYEQDVAAYAGCERMFPKPGQPENTFDVSMVPWLPFSSFHLHVAGEGKHLLPIFTMGQLSEEKDHLWLPLALQVHHAVCDGWHVGQFVARLQEKIHLLTQP